MELIVEGMKRGIGLLLRGDREVVEVVLLTLQVSGTATLLSLFFGVGIGALVGLRPISWADFLPEHCQYGYGASSGCGGPFCDTNALAQWASGRPGPSLYPYSHDSGPSYNCYTHHSGISVAAFQSLSQELRLQILSLGARRRQLVWLLIKEARLQLLAAVMAGFGGVVSEVGASMMVGGNIRGCTRVLTTATVMETAKGNFELAIALSVILLLLAYAVTVALTSLQQRGHKW